MRSPDFGIVAGLAVFVLLCASLPYMSIVSRDAIMTALWESDSFVDENTLSVNVNRLRRKLESAGVRDLIQTRKGVGYLVE